MELFPESIFFFHPIKTSQIWKTLITEFESGREQRRKVWTFPRRRLNLPIDIIEKTEIKTLWQFYQQHSGAYQVFYFYIPAFRHWYGDYVGRGTGSQAIFDLPSKSTEESSLIVYVNGVETSITFLNGGGEVGSDRIEFTSAPALGAVITADLYGKLRLKCRFEVDNLDDELFRTIVYKTGIGIMEVK